MRLPIPNRKLREHVVHLITMTYDTDDFEHLYEAAKIVTDFYHLPPARFTIRRKFKIRTDAGMCWDDGRIELLRPSGWQAEHLSRERWIHVALHELGHYVLWADKETKADLFADQWLK